MDDIVITEQPQAQNVDTSCECEECSTISDHVPLAAWCLGFLCLPTWVMTFVAGMAVGVRAEKQGASFANVAERQVSVLEQDIARGIAKLRKLKQA